jgi:signal transduction histidine kinase
MTGPEPAAALLQMALWVERDVFVVRQRGREVAAALGLEHQDQVRVATALSEIGRAMLAHGGANVTFSASTAPTQALHVELVSAARLDGTQDLGPDAAAVGRLVDTLAFTPGPASTTVRLSRRLPVGSPMLTPDRLSRLREELAALAPGTPLDELMAQNHQLVTALDEVRAQRDELARLNEELEETNRGVMALYGQLSDELEETNRGVVALYAELDEKSAQLRAASEAKSRFLANVSHELRAPVAAIIGLARLMSDIGSDPLTPEQARQTELITGSATDLLALVNDLLDLAKAEAGRLEPTWADVDLPELFGQLRGTLRPLATRSMVDFVVEEPGPGGPLHSDPVLLTHVLRNLLTNALKFTDSGRVRLRGRWLDGGERLELEVCDTGIGIPAELHERIFEEFFQVPGGSRERGPGTGLGLPYAKRLVSLLGGTLTLASAPGAGSTFTVTLPRAPAAPPQPSAPVGPVGRPLRRVLLVDDDATYRRSVLEQFAAAAIEVVEAGDGRAALAVVEESTPDAILLDLRMPELDGVAVLDALAADGRLRDIPVFVLSAVVPVDATSGAFSHAVAVLDKATTPVQDLPALVRSVVTSGGPT